jgi:hypothetical protein
MSKTRVQRDSQKLEKPIATQATSLTVEVIDNCRGCGFPLWIKISIGKSPIALSPDLEKEIIRFCRVRDAEYRKSLDYIMVSFPFYYDGPSAVSEFKSAMRAFEEGRQTEEAIESNFAPPVIPAPAIGPLQINCHQDEPLASAELVPEPESEVA